MFSPDVTVHAGGPLLRNPRRRQRHHSEDSIKSTRGTKRTKITKNTFIESPKDHEPHDNHQEPAREVAPKANGHVESLRSSKEVAPDVTTLTLRGPRKHEKRSGKSDNSMTLCKTDYYTVSSLPALPDRLRHEKIDPLRAYFSAEYGYALALTTTHALIWKYGSSASSPETCYLSLPYASNDVSDPLPLGAFTSRVSSREPGLVVIWPRTGKVVYWETISSAATEGLMRPKQSGVQGSVGGLFYSERITGITAAEPAGFIITLNSGRLVHLNVRDSQGRAAINTQFLENATSSFLGSLKNILPGQGLRRDIVAVRAGQTRQKGQCDVITATSTGHFQIWDVHWSGNSKLDTEAIAENDILEALKQTMRSTEAEQEAKLQLLDFCCIKSPGRNIEMIRSGEPSSTRLLLLTGFSNMESTRYSLLEVTISHGAFAIDVVHPLSCYTKRLASLQTWTPRVYLPSGNDPSNPGQMAFVIFETAICFMSLARAEESPEAQLLMGSQGPPAPFHDKVEFRHDTNISVIGCGEEDVSEGHRFPSVVLMLHNFGVVRIASFPIKGDLESLQGAKISAKSKIEQAIFYGTRPENPLDFSIPEEVLFAQDEVETAALAISDEILRSSSSFIPTFMPSIGHQLKLRATALRDLVLYLRKNFPPFSRLAKWKLLWNSERIATARAIWKSYEAMDRETNTETVVLLPQLMAYLSDGSKTLPSPELDETDQLRLYFIYDIWRIDDLMPWPFKTVSELYRDGTKEPAIVARLFTEANDITLALLETMYQFRQENVKMYGLEDEVIVDGVLRENYEGLPPFWGENILHVMMIKKHVDFVEDYPLKYWGKEPREGDPNPKHIQKLVHQLPRLIKVCAQVYLEHIGWCMVQDDVKLKNEAEHFANELVECSRVQITKLVGFDLVTEAIQLAERNKDMKTLVEVVHEAASEATLKAQQPSLSAEEDDLIQSKIESLESRIENFFIKYGDCWAKAYFEKLIEQGQLSDLLDEAVAGGRKAFATKFLRSKPAYAKLSWINDVTTEHDYRYASTTLEQVAIHQETDLWSKKVELSMAKLARLAATEGLKNADPITEQNHIQKYDKQFALVDIQQMLYNHLRPVFYTAIDERAEIDLAVEQFAKYIVKGKPTLHKILEQGLGNVVSREVMTVDLLVDVLTLMDPADLAIASKITGHEFFMALRTLELSGLADSDPAHHDLLAKIIWRRCLIRDDWEEIYKLDFKGDNKFADVAGGLVLFKTLKEIEEHRLLDGSGALKVLSPDDVVGAGCSPEELEVYFDKNEMDLCLPLAHDLNREDRVLKKYMQKGRLAKWFEAIKDGARTAVREEADHVGEEARRVQSLRAEVDGGIRARDGYPLPIRP
ncbi:MAG: hypothetical protein M1834_004590 [Cirrosporium novae-zelandiae]|nr:MAG: hypothetical protein M1834_004590 [Cirrosporium novae-zelandiae]